MRQCILEKTLARGGQADVTLISRENFILFTPMLHEVAAGDLSASDIVGPLRRILRYVKVAQAEVKQIDLSTRTVRCVAGLRQARVEFEFDHLLLALGSETNFFEMEDVRERAMTMKSLSDAALLRNRMVEFLEEANLQTDESICRRLLTFVVAGRRFCRSGNSGSRKRLPTRNR